jgi:hypothetical protein
VRVRVHLYAPPKTCYWDLRYGEDLIVAQLYWDGAPETKEFPTMGAFLAWAEQNRVEVPWMTPCSV